MHKSHNAVFFTARRYESQRRSSKMTLSYRPHITSYSSSAVWICLPPFNKYYHSDSVRHCLWPWGVIQLQCELKL